jgi:hypothetical protein
MFPGWTRLEAGPPAAEKAAAEARQKALGEGKSAEEAEKAAKAAGETARVAAIAEASLAAQTPEQTRVEMMAHNGSVIEVRKEGGRWTVVPDSRYARRITLDTPMRIAGPAAGHDRLKTSHDPTGTRVFGTINNCAGGKTPWGTVLMAEENFHGYFGGKPTAEAEAANYKRYGVGGTPSYAWHRSVDRFDLGEGAARAEPLRLDGRVRPLRPGLRAGEAHRARPRQARGRHLDPQQGRPGRVLLGRRRALRVPLQVRHRG